VYSELSLLSMSRTAVHGLLVIDKPAGITSRAVVDRVQRGLPRGTKIGHTGTLDPLATGVLVLCLGAATRLAEYLQGMTKTYRAGILLGSRSDTDDVDGTITPVENVMPPDRAAVEACLSGFLGVIEQTPPAFSAAKVAGRRAYDLARRGKDVDLQPRRVHIDQIDVLAYDYPHLQLEVSCGKGTYIRSLARDVGDRLGCGGLIETLRRTRVGPFTEQNALPLDAGAEAIRSNLLPLASAVSHLVAVRLDESKLAKLRQGLAVPAQVIASPEDGDVAVFDERGALVALARFDLKSGLLKPEKVIVL
jgi:tRNA pseudouridine55 synthase